MKKKYKYIVKLRFNRASNGRFLYLRMGSFRNKFLAMINLYLNRFVADESDKVFMVREEIKN